MIDNLIEDLIHGRLTPEEAVEKIRMGPEQITRFVPDFDMNILDRLRDGTEEGKNLIAAAQFNLVLAEKTGLDDYVAQTSLTLSQALPPEPDHLRSRITLIERALSILEEQERDESLMSETYWFACLAYGQLLQLASADHDMRRAIELGERSLACNTGAQALSAAQQLQVHMTVGTYLNDVDDVTAENLAHSVDHLRRALEIARVSSDNIEIGSVLNNLGNSLRMLGARTKCEVTLSEAIDVLQEASKHRNGAAAERTNGNIANAQRELEALKSANTVTDTPARREAQKRLKSAELMLKRTSQQDKLTDQLRDENRRQAVACGSQAIQMTDPIEDSEVFGRAMLAIAIAADMGPSTGEAGLAVCFGRAAERYFSRSQNEQRLAATHFNLGKAYSTIRGAAGDYVYLRQASDCFEKSWHEHDSLDIEAPATQSLSWLVSCYSLMGKNGDKVAEKRSEELLTLLHRRKT